MPLYSLRLLRGIWDLGTASFFRALLLREA